MELNYKNRKLKAACESEKDANRLWGAQCARIVRRRLAQLAAADSLAVIETIPPARLHPLSGVRAGQFAVDARQPYRLIFEPWHDDVPLSPDGSVDKARITRVRILGVEDYH